MQNNFATVLLILQFAKESNQSREKVFEFVYTVNLNVGF